jgi:lysophospholipase L1-like esterase
VFAVALVVLSVVLVFVIGGDDGAPAPVTPSGPPSNAPRTVVAMGDSTISGEGAGNYEQGTAGENGNWCHRSPDAAVHRTEVPDVRITVNLACSGSDAKHVGLGESEHYTEGSQAARLARLAATDRVVAIVVGVGANDEPKFGEALNRCVQAYFDKRSGCAAELGRTWQQRVDAMVPKVAKALRDIRTVMSQAGYPADSYQLVLQSYAAPVGPDIAQGLQSLAGCPLRSDDVTWVRDTATPLLNAGLRKAADQAGVRFLDLTRAGYGHEACSGGTDPASEWFARLTVAWNDLNSGDRAGHALQESFHPNATGQAEIGRCLTEFLSTPDSTASCVEGPDGHLHAVR